MLKQCVQCKLNLKFRRKIAISKISEQISNPLSNFIILNLFGMPLYIQGWFLLVKTRNFYGQVVGPRGGQAIFPKKWSPVLPLRGPTKRYILTQGVSGP